MYTHILSSSPTFTLTSAHHKLMHKHSLSHHNAFSFFTMHIQCQHLPQNGIFFPFFFPTTYLFNLHLEQSPFLCVTCSNFVFLQVIFKTCLRSFTPNTSNCLQPASSKSLCVRVCVCVCACVCVHVCHIYMGLGGWDEVWWQICVYCVLMLVVLA